MVCCRDWCWHLLLFITYFDLDVNVGGMISKFARGSKIDVVSSEEGCRRLHQGLHQLGKCTKEWQMLFKTENHSDAFWEVIKPGQDMHSKALVCCTTAI